MKRVKTGLEVIQSRHFDIVKGERLGLVVHSASVNSNLEHTVDLFLKKRQKVVSLFGPQHGIYGETQANMIEWKGFRESHSGLKVFSLYGETREPTEIMMEDLDLIVVDLQDVGARYYTFIWTLYLTLKVCSRLKKKVVILDRPNPMNGIEIEGPVLLDEFRSFVGLHPLPPRHGMTLGELALFFSEEAGFKPAPTIEKMEGWDREMWFDETGLPWVMPSPNIPTLESAIVYPGMCLLEGTNLSEGRGTTRPFEIFGAPWIDPWILERELKKKNLPGISFRRIHFIPTFNKYEGVLCGGAQLHLNDRKDFRPFLTSMAILQTVKYLYPKQFEWR